MIYTLQNLCQKRKLLQCGQRLKLSVKQPKTRDQGSTRTLVALLFLDETLYNA